MSHYGRSNNAPLYFYFNNAPSRYYSDHRFRPVGSLRRRHEGRDSGNLPRGRRSSTSAMRSARSRVDRGRILGRAGLPLFPARNGARGGRRPGSGHFAPADFGWKRPGSVSSRLITAFSRWYYAREKHKVRWITAEKVFSEDRKPNVSGRDIFARGGSTLARGIAPAKWARQWGITCGCILRGRCGRRGVGGPAPYLRSIASEI